MSNPYYIPRDNTRMQNMLGLANLAVQLYGLKQQGDIAGQQTEVNRERNLLTAEDIQQRGAIAGREANIAEQKNQIGARQVQTERLKIPYHKQPYGYGDDALLRANLSRFGINPTDESNPIVQRSRELAKTDSVTKLDAYQSLHDDPEMKQAVLDAMEKKITSGVQKNPNYIQTKEGQDTYRAMQYLSSPEGWGKAVDMVFQNTLTSAKQEEQAAQAASDTAAAHLASATRTTPLTYDQSIAARMNAGGMTPQEASGLVHPRAPEKASLVPPGTAVLPPGAAKPIYTNPPLDQAPTVVPAGSSVLPRGATRPTYTAPEAGPKPSEVRVTARDVSNAETMITTNASKEEAVGKVDFFNQYAEKPYAYTWVPGKLYGGEWKKIDLPKVRGVQVTARHVYEKAAADGTTYEEVLRAIGAIK